MTYSLLQNKHTGTFALLVSDEDNTVVLPYETLQDLSTDLEKLQVHIAILQKQRGDINVH